MLMRCAVADFMGHHSEQPNTTEESEASSRDFDPLHPLNLRHPAFLPSTGKQNYRMRSTTILDMNCEGGKSPYAPTHHLLSR